jgi:hypothetical protein
VGSAVTGLVDVGAIVGDTEVGLLDVGEMDGALVGEVVGQLVAGCIVTGL